MEALLLSHRRSDEPVYQLHHGDPRLFDRRGRRHDAPGRAARNARGAHEVLHRSAHRGGGAGPDRNGERRGRNAVAERCGAVRRRGRADGGHRERVSRRADLPHAPFEQRRVQRHHGKHLRPERREALRRGRARLGERQRLPPLQAHPLPHGKRRRHRHDGRGEGGDPQGGRGGAGRAARARIRPRGAARAL